MRKSTLCLSLFLTVALLVPLSALTAQEVQKNQEEKTTQKNEDKENEKIGWDKSKHVFGSIEHKKPVTTEFTFTNNSTEIVTISKVGTTCGCTVPTYSKEPIKPGESGKIKLLYDAVTPGFFKKAAKIHFSDGSTKEIEVEGKVVVRQQNIR